jgi:excisionase family DNA binding protein
MLDDARFASSFLQQAARNSEQIGGTMDQEQKSKSPKLGWTFEELASSLSVSVPFLRLEVKRGRLKAAHLGRRVVLLDSDVRRYLAEASDRAA